MTTPAPTIQQITIEAPEGPEGEQQDSPPARSPSSPRSAPPSWEQIAAALTETLTELAARQVQHQKILQIMGERLDQLAHLHEERDRVTGEIQANMLQTTQLMEQMIGQQERAREELGIATAALAQVTMDLRTMYELEAQEDQEDGEQE